MRPITLGALCFAAVAGCSASPNVFPPPGGTGGASSSSGSSGTIHPGTGGAGATGQGGGNIGFGGSFTSSSGGTGGGASGCSAAAQLVYVFTLGNEIYSFDPPSKTFTYVATPDCQTAGQPNSMAIDRNLVAWINYIGAIYTFDLNTKSGCQLALNLPAGYQQVGMGFSSDSMGGTAETLYVDGIGGAGLAKIDTATKTLVPIGGFSSDPNLAGQSAELTGTGDARLFGYFTTFPYVRVAQLDKATANVLSDNVLTGVSPPSDWAFSFWGGDFYLYAAPGSNATGNSSVIHYSPVNNAVDPTYVADTGFQIIGAGVSTCAPFKPPN